MPKQLISTIFYTSNQLGYHRSVPFHPPLRPRPNNHAYYAKLYNSQFIPDSDLLFLAYLLYYSFVITFIVLAPSALLSDFLKLVKPACTCEIYRPAYMYSLPCYLPLVVYCTMHRHLSLRISMPHIGSQHLYFIKTLSLSMMQIHIQSTT